MIFIASPLAIKLCFAFNFLAVAALLSGALFIVVFAAFLGIVLKNKKAFEVLFFAITYANLNNIPFADYYSIENAYYLSFGIISIGLLTGLYLIKFYRLRGD